MVRKLLGASSRIWHSSTPCGHRRGIDLRNFQRFPQIQNYRTGSLFCRDFTSTKVLRSGTEPNGTPAQDTERGRSTPLKSHLHQLPEQFRLFAADFDSEVPQVALKDLLDQVEDYMDKEVSLYGYLGARVNISKKLCFSHIYTLDPYFAKLQLVVADALVERLKSVDTHSPIFVRGKLRRKRKSKSASSESRSTNGALKDAASQSRFLENRPLLLAPQSDTQEEAEIHLEDIVAYNTFPPDSGINEDRAFGPQQRHLQIRTDHQLRYSLKFRSDLIRHLREGMHALDFQEIETPLLFKSTSEGAQEFLVPTRSHGMAYALPQSPQQYKQILMASGIPKYFQLAKCFRDEDSRKDRQPEFTQLDLEVAFQSGRDVRCMVESVVKTALQKVISSSKSNEKDFFPSSTFGVLDYSTALADYGIDKPDLRIPGKINRAENLSQELQSMLTSLKEPVFEAIGIPMGTLSQDPRKTRQVVHAFLASPDGLVFQNNPHGAPGVFVFDTSKPLQGLSALGFEGPEMAASFFPSNFLNPGDLLIIQARPKHFHADSTPLGTLRIALQDLGEQHNLLPLREAEGWKFSWVINRPLFEPESNNPTSGTPQGLKSAHHPFTSPLDIQETLNLVRAIENRQNGEEDHSIFNVLGDAYDLVLNGVEIGGGSRRIHSAEVQKYIFTNALRLSEGKVKEFDHLLEILRCGCPPHAGFAIGIDRFIATLLGKATVRDVIAFPKVGGGSDPMVNSPSPITNEQLGPYGLKLGERNE